MGLVAEGGQKGPPRRRRFFLGDIFANFGASFCVCLRIFAFCAYFCIFLPVYYLFLPIFAYFLAARPVIHQSAFGGRKRGGRKRGLRPQGWTKIRLPRRVKWTLVAISVPDGDTELPIQYRCRYRYRYRSEDYATYEQLSRTTGRIHYE